MKIFKKVIVKNAFGLHIRPAAVIVKLLKKRKSEVSFKCNGKIADARSIMDMMTLVAKKNSNLLISIDGIDAKDTMNDLVNIFESKFGE